MRHATWLILLPLVACAEYDFAAKEGSDTGWGAPSDDADADSDADSDADTDHGSEDEDAFPMLAPATTTSYVFVANPDRDTVTRISVPSLQVLTVEVGVHPEVVTTTSDYSRAVVFASGSDELDVIDADTLEVQSVSLRPNLNAMAVSPDGSWAVVFRDADRVADEEGGSTGGVESYNEASLVNVDTLEHFPMVVGQNPRQVKFTEQSDLALVVSDAEVSVIDLTAAVPVPESVEISEDPLDPARAEEVEISPAGDFAFVRQFQSDEIVVLDLVTGEVGRVPVGYNPTDLDILPDGSRAAVVSRGSEELWLLDAADPFQPPEVLSLPSGEVLGSLLVSPEGDLGILYTTAALTDRYAVWEVATGEFTVRSLVKPVSSMTVSPDGGTLLVLHTKENTEGMSSTDPYYNAYALTLMKLSDFRQNPLRLAAEPSAWAHSGDGKHGYFIMEGEPDLVVLDYATLLPEDILLKSVPVHVGTLPETEYAYASQEHSLGRISFYDAANGELETVTGFELNSEIEH